MQLSPGENSQITKSLNKRVNLAPVTQESPVVQKTPEQEKEEKIALLREKKLYNNVEVTDAGEKLYEYTRGNEKVIRYGENDIFALRE